MITHAKDTSQIYSLFNTRGGLFTISPQLKRVLHVSTGKHISCHCCSHGCRGTFPDFTNFQPNHPARGVARKAKQPLCRSAPSPPCVHPLGTLSSGQDGNGGGQAGRGEDGGVHQTPSACPVCLSKGSIGGGCRQYLSRGSTGETWRGAGVWFRSGGEDCRAQAESSMQGGSWDCARAVGH